MLEWFRSLIVKKNICYDEYFLFAAVVRNFYQIPFLFMDTQFQKTSATNMQFLALEIGHGFVPRIWAQFCAYKLLTLKRRLKTVQFLVPENGFVLGAQNLGAILRL